MDPGYLWRFLLVGYALTIAIETPILMVGLSVRHSYAKRLAAGFWLTGCSYPIVVLAMPLALPDAYYLWVAETLAPLSECVLFWLAFQRGRMMPWSSCLRDYAAIILANLASFGIGLVIGDWVT